MRLFVWVTLVGACAIPTTATAQEHKSRTATAARAIASSLAASHRDIHGKWVLIAERGCGGGLQQPACTFRDRLSPSDDSVILAELKEVLAATTDMKTFDDVKTLRLANSARAQTQNRRVTCGDAELDGNAIKLLRVEESRASGDTLQARLTVAQYGSLAYCMGGAQVYLFTSVAKAGSLPTVSMQRLEHYELMLEVPKRKN